MIKYKLLILTGSLLLCSACTDKEPLVPANIIQNFLAPYSQAEKKLIKKDHKNIRELCFLKAKNKKLYVATAGPPAASKSTILETHLKNRPGFVYVDPDQRALKFMIYTYLQETNNYNISRNKSYRSLLKKAYNKWRAASNYIANSILNEAYTKNFAIAHGTTSTNKNIDSLYKKLKNKGYKITLLLCNSPKKNRIKATKYRAKKQCLVQSTYKDLIKKENMFYERFPTYFKFADQIEMFWIDNFAKGWTKVATYSKPKGFKKLHQDYEKFAKSYEDYRNKHTNKKLPSLEALVKPKNNSGLRGQASVKGSGVDLIP